VYLINTPSGQAKKISHINATDLQKIVPEAAYIINMAMFSDVARYLDL
jgi:hypothetical protein